VAVAAAARGGAGAVTVSLRRARLDDADFLLALITDEETRPFLGGRTGDSRDAIVFEIERSEREPDAFGWFVVEFDGERAGSVAFHRTNERNRIAEAGRFAVVPEFRGRGVGLEAARQFQRLLLVDLDFHRVELQIYGFNERAIAHAERCGYVREGVKRKAYMKHGEWQDAVLFSLLREDLDDE
jgi:RimJ/RimL family protein N-acetyltransferase